MAFVTNSLAAKVAGGAVLPPGIASALVIHGAVD
jgi:hypothetical protein